MGARLNTVFHRGNRKDPVAVVYGHWAGDCPVEAAETLKGFFDAVEAQTEDKRYTDPSYLAAKYVVYLALEGGRVPDKPLDFLSVGVVVAEDDCGPECIAYVDCSVMHPATKRPTVEFDDGDKEEADEILGQSKTEAK